MIKVIIASLVLVSGISVAHSSPLFEDDDSVQQCGVCDSESDTHEDSLGRIEDIEGDKWKQGADGTWRSDGGESCKWSEALGKFVCN